ncbi:MAG: DUF4143 domain-containing protein [Chloroflexota bacterium]
MNDPALRLPPFSRNPRREIGKQSKIYFLDLGIRNALIGDFNDLSLRPDRGAVWENFLIIERRKAYLNRGRTVQSRFWRTYGGAEVDYINLRCWGARICVEYEVPVLANGEEIKKRRGARTYTLYGNFNISRLGTLSYSGSL